MNILNCNQCKFCCITILLSLCFITHAHVGAQQVQFQFSFGSLGTGNGQFNNPVGVRAAGGNVYVADTNNDRVQVFDSAGNFLLAFGSTGTGNGQFRVPASVTVNAAGDMYVVDAFNNRVQVFNSSGTFQFSFGTLGSGNGQFNIPLGVATDATGNVYVADRGNHRIQKFDAAGNFQFAFGSSGIGDGQFNHPAILTLDSLGNIYVPDEDNDRVQVFDSIGTFLFAFGTAGTGDGQLDDPISVAVDGEGNIFVADSDNHRVQVFDSVGVFKVAFGSFGTGDGEFDDPPGVAVDDLGNIYVTDRNDRVQVFRMVPEPTLPDSFKLADGVHVGGLFSDVYASDDQYFELDPSPTKNLLKQKIHLIMQSQSPTTTPSEFTFRFESVMTGGLSGDVIQTIELFNYNTNQLELLDTRSVANVDESIEVMPGGDPSRFVNPINSEISAEVTWKSESFSGAMFRWSIDVDEAVWVVAD